MTIYELTQAIIRYKRVLFTGLGLLVVFVLMLTFTVEDGGITWRGGLKFESAFQISVVTPGTASLSEPGTGRDLGSAAAAFADLLTTGEAATAIGEMSGFVLDETVNASVARGTSIISGTVIGPSSDLAKAASQNTFVWLAQKIQQPLNSLPLDTTAPPSPDVILEGAFPSTLSVEVANSLSSVSLDLFVLIAPGQNRPIAIPVVQRAGTTVAAPVALEAGGSLLLNLEASDGTPYDTLRLAPDPLPRTALAYPTLIVRLGSGALTQVDDEEGQPIWAFNGAAITTEWIEGTPPTQSVESSTQQLQIAMLTDVPTAQQIGGRRGPLVGFTVLLVGLISLLTGVIVADTWRRERDAREVSTLRVPYEVSGEPELSHRRGTALEVESSTAGAGESSVVEPAQHE